MKSLFFTLFVVFAISIWSPGHLRAQIITSSQDDGTPGTLRAQIDAAAPGATLNFMTTVTTVNINREILIDKDITITGATGVTVTIDAAGNSRIFNVTNGVVVLNNLTLSNGVAADGGGIFNSANLSMNNCFVNACIANGASGSGGGVFNSTGGVFAALNTSFNGNVANRAGGAIEDNSGMGLGIILNDVTMTDNNAGAAPAATAAPGHGGALHITGPGDTRITDCTVTGNTAAEEGGGLWNSAGIMIVSTSTIEGNTAQGDGADQGGGGLFNNGGTLIVNNCQVINNETTGPSTSGGGILNDMGTLTVFNGTIDGNTAIRAGGGIEDNSIEGGMLTLNSVAITNNTTGSSPGNGGGVHITGPGNAAIANCIVTDNEAASEGGGLWNSIGSMTVSNTIIENNVAFGEGADNGGGGIFNNGGDMIINVGSIIRNNLATGTAGSGGGFFSVAGSINIFNVEFINNSANRAGGAIEIIDGNLIFNNSTMVGNDVSGTAGAPAPGNGGGIHVTGNTALVSILGSVLTDNEAGREGGAIWNQVGSEMSILFSTIDSNLSFGDAADQGGAGCFNNGGIMSILQSTISNNVDMGEAARGAGVHNVEDGDMFIRASTISGNSSSTGGGIFNGGTVDIESSTIAFNDASFFGGGISNVGTTSLRGTIVSNNNSSDEIDDDLHGETFISNNYNLIGTDLLGALQNQSDDIVFEDPLLLPLSADGQQTATHSFEFGSPVVNAGAPDDLSTDQNGFEVFDERRDIGSHEAQEILSSTEVLTAAESNIRIFPNPTDSQTTIEVPFEFGEDITISIYSASTGQLLSEVAASNGTNFIQLGSYANGVYIVRVNSSTFTSAQLVNKIK